MVGSIVIPAYNREDTIDRTIGSLSDRGLVRDTGAWEIVVVDDASTDGTKKRISYWENKYPKLVIGIKLPEHQERVVALQSGIHYSRGEWIVMLDSDDELAGHFFKAFTDALHLYPQAEIINWGSLFHWFNKETKRYERTSILETYHPPVKEDGTIGVFRAGGVTSGAFAFKKSLLLERGYIPTAHNPFTLGEKFLKMYPEIVPLYNPGQTDLGNPWGQDFMWAYHLSRGMAVEKWVSLNQILHFKHQRT